jgi:hypothetical protein
VNLPPEICIIALSPRIVLVVHTEGVVAHQTFSPRVDICDVQYCNHYIARASIQRECTAIRRATPLLLQHRRRHPGLSGNNITAPASSPQIVPPRVLIVPSPPSVTVTTGGLPFWTLGCRRRARPSSRCSGTLITPSKRARRLSFVCFCDGACSLFVWSDYPNGLTTASPSMPLRGALFACRRMNLIPLWVLGTSSVFCVVSYFFASVRNKPLTLPPRFPPPAPLSNVALHFRANS